MAVKRANDQRVGAVPYGYDLAGDGVTLVQNEAEQTILMEIKSRRSSGMTLQELATTLTKRRVSTKTGKSDSWTHQTIARLLRRSE